MSDLIQLLKFSIIVFVPLWLLLTKRYNGILLWLGMTMGFEVLNVTVMASVTPFQVFGLLYLPFAFHQLPKMTVTRVGKLILWSFVFLMFLGFLYGYIAPWSDTSYVRPVSQRAQGRSVIFLLHTLAGLSITFFVAQMIEKYPGSISKLLRYLLIGTSIAASGVILAWLTHIDLWAVLSPNVHTYDIFTIGRMRGLNGEPRVSGQLCAWGVLLLMGLSGLGWKRMPLLILHIAGLLLTISTSALIILLVGTIVLIVRAPLSKPQMILSILAVTLLVALFAQAGGSRLETGWRTNVFNRLDRSAQLGPPRDLGEAIADKLEVFDASAVLFLWHNPIHLLVGTGPGLISLPASEYIPSYARAIYGDRIDSVPHMGFFLTLANGGAVGLLLWFAIIFSSLQALRRQTIAKPEVIFWQEGFTYFIVFSVLYLLQAKDVWYLFLGIGLGAAIIQSTTVRDREHQFAVNGYQR